MSGGVKREFTPNEFSNTWYNMVDIAGTIPDADFIPPEPWGVLKSIELTVDSDSRDYATWLAEIWRKDRSLAGMERATRLMTDAIITCCSDHPLGMKSHLHHWVQENVSIYF